MELWPQIIGLTLSPPGLIVLCAVVSLLAYVARPWLGALLFTLTTGLLVIFSLPMTGHQMLGGLQDYAAAAGDEEPAAAGSAPQAIVVLGAGRRTGAPEYRADTVDPLTLERLRYAAHLHRRTGLPILVSGGAPFREEIAEAELMQTALREDFRVEVKWLEAKSNSTIENARFSRDILTTAGIRHVHVVTHAWHMRRAAWSFELYGIGVTPAPTGFSTLGRKERSALGYLPTANGLAMTSLALRERLAYLWYTYSYRSMAAPAEPER
ncbi:MAG TPA: YdcF family protein [Acidiferrobacterales bacterium]|jgi:uncharacterized SAM-binding protein YcdF (DUF218 family)